VSGRHVGQQGDVVWRWRARERSWCTADAEPEPLILWRSKSVNAFAERFVRSKSAPSRSLSAITPRRSIPKNSKHQALTIPGAVLSRLLELDNVCSDKPVF
jgi:hypothetical protein